MEDIASISFFFTERFVTLIPTHDPLNIDRGEGRWGGGGEKREEVNGIEIPGMLFVVKHSGL